MKTSALRPHSDTSAAAERVRREVLDRKSPEELVRLAFEASEFVRALALQGITLRHPEYGPADQRLALARMLLGEALFHEVHPGVDIAP